MPSAAMVVVVVGRDRGGGSVRRRGAIVVVDEVVSPPLEVTTASSIGMATTPNGLDRGTRLGLTLGKEERDAVVRRAEYQRDLQRRGVLDQRRHRHDIPGKKLGLSPCSRWVDDDTVGTGRLDDALTADRKAECRSSSVSPTTVSASAPATEKRTSAGAIASPRPRKIWNISASRSSARPSPSHRPVSGSITSTTRGEKFCSVELSKSVNASASRTSSAVVRSWSRMTLSAAELTRPARVVGLRAPRATARSIAAEMKIR